MPLTPEDLGTILVVGAHPDDETYLTSGILVAAMRSGQHVATLTATTGQEGSFDEERWPTATMGETRRAELLAGFDVLGVTDHTILDQYDGKVSDVDPAEGTAVVLEHLRRVEADTVLTFGPDGMTGHPDHQAVSAWTSEAVAQARAQDGRGTRLAHATYVPEWVDTYKARLDAFNVFMAPGTPPVVPRESLMIDYHLPDDIAELKVRAIECHVSQTEAMFEMLGRDFFTEGMREEYFVEATPDPAE